MFALALLCASAAAVAHAQPPTIEEFTREPLFRSASLSPNGRYVSGIRRENDLDLLVVIDWRASSIVSIQRANRAEGVFLNWAIWKTDDRLVLSVSQNIRLNWRPSTGSRVDPADEQVPIERIFAMNGDGTPPLSPRRFCSSMANRTTSSPSANPS